jgi:hypothetical protein
MTNKKGIDGMYTAVALLIGIVIGMALMYFAISKGMLSCELIGCASTAVPII